MRIKLIEPQTIKAKDYEPGDEVIVTKELGEEMVDCGLAESLEERVIEVPEDRVIEEPENRMRAVRFSNHKKIYANGSDGKDYVLKGTSYVELEE